MWGSFMHCLGGLDKNFIMEFVLMTPQKPAVDTGAVLLEEALRLY